MVNIKRASLLALSIMFLLVGVLGIANVRFFVSNAILEVLEIALGVAGLVIATR